MPLRGCWESPHDAALLENVTDAAIALLFVTKFSTISLYLTKLCVTLNFASSVEYSEIRQCGRLNPDLIVVQLNVVIIKD